MGEISLRVATRRDRADSPCLSAPYGALHVLDASRRPRGERRVSPCPPSRLRTCLGHDQCIRKWGSANKRRWRRALVDRVAVQWPTHTARSSASWLARAFLTRTEAHSSDQSLLCSSAVNTSYCPSRPSMSTEPTEQPEHTLCRISTYSITNGVLKSCYLLCESRPSQSYPSSEVGRCLASGQFRGV